MRTRPDNQVTALAATSLLVVVLVVSGAGCGGGGGSACERNADCPSGLCVSGVCRGVASSAHQECTDDEGCGYGMRCLGGRCERTTSCVADAECVAAPAGRCEGGRCSYGAPPAPGCRSDADCPGGSCDTVAGECEGGADCAGGCDDGDPCTQDTCGEAGCSHTAIAACCAGGLSCDDGDPCTDDLCVEDACRNTPVADPSLCCRSDGDCDDGDPNTVDRCRDDRCVFAAGCGASAECDDGDGCTTDSCQDGACRNDRVPGCCRDGNDCNDGDACTSDRCVAGICQYAPAPGCCATDADCEDGSACTTDRCNADGRCEQIPISGCCTSAADCADNNLCTADACLASTCSNQPVAGCCRTVADCGPPPPCFDVACVSNSCRTTERDECCSTDADCDDGIARTNDLCGPGGVCGHEWQWACETDPDCGDGNPCTVDTCLQPAGVCTHAVFVDPSCRCEVESDCDTRGGGVCSIIATETQGYLTYCVDPIGALTMGTVCDPGLPQACESGVCLEINGTPICYGACGSDAECAGSSSCGRVVLTGGAGQPENEVAVCAPEPLSCANDATCPEDMYCDAYTTPDAPLDLRFGCFYLQGGLGRTGGACAVNEDCESGYCIPDEERGSVCFGVCDRNQDCRGGQRCYPDRLYITLDDRGTATPADDVVADLPSCQWDDGSMSPCRYESDCPAGEVCFPYVGVTGDAFEPACRLPLAGATVPPGGDCSADAQCQTALCIDAETQGACFLFCANSLDCPGMGFCDSVEFTFTGDASGDIRLSADVCVHF